MRARVSLFLFFVVVVWAVPAHATDRSAGGVAGLKLADDLAWVEVSVEGKAEPLHFILDTGASISVLDRATAREMSVKLGRRLKVLGIQGSTVGHTTTGFRASLTSLSQVGQAPAAAKLLGEDWSRRSSDSLIRRGGGMAAQPESESDTIEGSKANSGRETSVAATGSLMTDKMPVLQGQHRTQSPQLDPTLSLPERILVLDLGRLSRMCHRRVDGLVGADYFEGRRVQLDFAEGTLRVGNACLAVDDSATTLKLARRNGAWCISGAVDTDRTQWCRIDTGYDGALAWFPGKTSGRPASDTPSVATSLNLPELGPAIVRFDGLTLEDVPTSLLRRRPFPGEAGLVGLSLLSQFRMTLEVDRERMLLEAGQCPDMEERGCVTDQPQQFERAAADASRTAALQSQEIRTLPEAASN